MNDDHDDLPLPPPLELVDLPTNPLTLMAQYEQIEARILDLRQTFGDDPEGWPPADVARTIRDISRLWLDYGFNEVANRINRDRLDEYGRLLDEAGIPPLEEDGDNDPDGNT